MAAGDVVWFNEAMAFMIDGGASPASAGFFIQVAT
jgi:hypothetical protein